MGHPRCSICNCHRTVCFRNRHHIVCTSQMLGSAAVKIDTFAYLPVQDFGNAYSTFIAQNYGAGKKDRIRKGTKESFLLSFIFCIIISAIFCIFAAPLITIFVSAKETAVITCGVQYLRIEGSFYCGIGCLSLPNYIHKPCKNSFFMLSLIIE